MTSKTNDTKSEALPKYAASTFSVANDEEDGFGHYYGIVKNAMRPYYLIIPDGSDADKICNLLTFLENLKASDPEMARKIESGQEVNIHLSPFAPELEGLIESLLKFHEDLGSDLSKKIEDGQDVYVYDTPKEENMMKKVFRT